MIEMQKYNVVVIGLGRIGCTYDINDYSNQLIMSHAKACTLNPSLDLVAGVDTELENRTRFKKRYNTLVFQSFEQIPESVRCDIVIVAVTTSSHFKLIREILDRPCRPRVILCEKPISFSFDEVQKICKLSRKFNVPILVNYIRRVLPETSEVNRFIQDRKITPVRGCIWYSQGLMNSASHMIDLCRLWFGEIELISGLESCPESGDLSIDFSVKFANAQVTFLYSPLAAPFELNGSFLSPLGMLKYERCGEIIEWYDLVADPHGNGYLEPSNIPYSFSTTLNTYQQSVMNDVVDYIANGASLLPSVSDLLPMHLKIHNTCLTTPLAFK